LIQLRRQSILKGAFISAGSKGLARFLRFLLLIVIAHKFGTGAETDAYFVIQTLTVLFLTLNDTIFNFSLIPTLTNERIKHGEEEERELASSAFAYLNLFFFAVSLFIFMAADPLARAMAVGLDEQTKQFTSLLIKIIAPIPFLAGLGGVPAAIFYANRNFVFPSVTFLFYGISSIVAAVLLSDLMGVTCVPMGAAFGVGLQAVVLIVVLWKAKKLSFSFRYHKRLNDLFLLTAPRIVGRLLVGVTLAVDKLLATSLAVGSVSCLTLAFRLNQFPIALLIAPLGTSMPHMAENAAAGNFKEIRQFVGRIVGLITFMVLPVMVGLLIMRVPVIGMLFERGKFERAATETTASIFFFYNLGILFMALNIFLIGVFFALRNWRLPLVLSVFDCVTNIVLAWQLRDRMGLDGIGLAKSLIAVINIAIYLFLLQKKIGVLNWREILTRSVLRIVAACATLGVGVWLVVNLGPSLWGEHRYWITVMVSIVVGIGLYLVSSVVFGVREIKEARKLIKKKLSRKNNGNSKNGEKHDKEKEKSVVDEAD